MCDTFEANGKALPCGFCLCRRDAFVEIGVLVKAGDLDAVRGRLDRSPNKREFLLAPGFAGMNALLHLACAVTDYGERGVRIMGAAYKRQWPAILEYLLNAGAPVNLRNFSGDTPLTIAVTNCPPRRLGQTVDILRDAGADPALAGRLGRDASALIDLRQQVAEAKGFDFGTLNDAGFAAMFAGEPEAFEPGQAQVKHVEGRLPLDAAVGIMDTVSLALLA